MIDLDRIRIWLAANKLTLNTAKREFLLIGSRQILSTLERNPIIDINQLFPIKQVSTSKSLGGHIDGNLSWDCHINEISKKIASGVSVIKRIRYFLPFEILLNVHNSLVQPHFDYCNVVWGNGSKNLSSKLQRLQNRAARVITFSNYDCSTSELFQNLKWSKLVHQSAVSKAIMMHSIVNNTAPEDLSSRFVRRCALTSYNLSENEYKLVVPQPRTEFYERSISYSGSVLWNKLPLEVRQLTSPNFFKGKLRDKFRLANNLISDMLFLQTASLKSRCFLFIFIILVFILDILHQLGG